ncbi:MAG: hypothetical protein ABW185_17805 [Sedimenticola sp.]
MKYISSSGEASNLDLTLYSTVVMDEEHLAHAVRYISHNPVCAKLVRRVQDWPWSSATAHLSGKDDELVKVAPVLERYGDFSDFLGQGTDDTTAFNMLRRSETTGRPLGSEEWIEKLEKQTDRILKPQKRGPKRNSRDDN